MQKFSYHTHTNTLGIFDGKNSIKEMLERAQEIGYTEIGISNHLIYHPNMQSAHPMFFNDKTKAFDAYKKLKEDFLEHSELVKIKTHFGFEVDYFDDIESQKFLDKVAKELEPDYLIGASHYLFDKKTNTPLNIYLNSFSKNNLEELLFYWENMIKAVQSKRFDFIAHLDVLKIYNLFAVDGVETMIDRFLQSLADNSQPIELNTSGWVKAGEQHPSEQILKTLKEGGVPIVISDDAHSTDALSQYYEKAESLLSDLKYTNRFKL